MSAGRSPDVGLAGAIGSVLRSAPGAIVGLRMLSDLSVIAYRPFDAVIASLGLQGLCPVAGLI